MHDAGQFRLRLRAPDGTHIARTEKYAIDAANKVWRRVLDQLPVDTVTTLRRWCMALAIYAVVALIVGATLGWNLREYRYRAVRQSQQAATEQPRQRAMHAKPQIRRPALPLRPMPPLQ